VVQAHIIDERSEWRTFSDRDKESDDPNRVGGPTNALLGDAGLTTVIARTRGDGGASFALHRLHARAGGGPERALSSAFKAIGGMCERLGLVEAIRDHAQKTYKAVAEAGRGARGRTAHAVYLSAIYIACRQLGMPRTFKEMQATLPGMDAKDVSRAYKAITRCFQDDALAGGGPAGVGAGAPAASANAFAGVTNPLSFVPRFCSALAVEPRERRAIEESVRAACPDAPAPDMPWDGRNPTSKVSAVIFIISQLNADPGQRLSYEEVAKVAGIAPTTVRTAYRDMRPHLRALVSPAFASDEQLAAMPDPDKPLPGRAAASAAAAAAGATAAAAGGQPSSSAPPPAAAAAAVAAGLSARN